MLSSKSSVLVAQCIAIALVFGFALWLHPLASPSGCTFWLHPLASFFGFTFWLHPLVSPFWLEHNAGGYAPREAASKVRGLSYSRSVMAVHVPAVDEADAGMHFQAAPDAHAKAIASKVPQSREDQPQVFLLANSRYNAWLLGPCIKH